MNFSGSADKKNNDGWCWKTKNYDHKFHRIKKTAYNWKKYNSTKNYAWIKKIKEMLPTFYELKNTKPLIS